MQYFYKFDIRLRIRIWTNLFEIGRFRISNNQNVYVKICLLVLKQKRVIICRGKINQICCEQKFLTRETNLIYFLKQILIARCFWSNFVPRQIHFEIRPSLLDIVAHWQRLFWAVSQWVPWDRLQRGELRSHCHASCCWSSPHSGRCTGPCRGTPLYTHNVFMTTVPKGWIVLYFNHKNVPAFKTSRLRGLLMRLDTRSLITR